MCEGLLYIASLIKAAVIAGRNTIQGQEARVTDLSSLITCDTVKSMNDFICKIT